MARDELGGPAEGGCFFGAQPTHDDEDEPSGAEREPQGDVRARVPRPEREARQGERFQLEVAVFVLGARAGREAVVCGSRAASPAGRARLIAEREDGRAGGTCRLGRHSRADGGTAHASRNRGSLATPTTRGLDEGVSTVAGENAKSAESAARARLWHHDSLRRLRDRAAKLLDTSVCK